MLKRKTKVKKLAINKLLIIMATICTMFAIAIILLPILSKGEMQLLSKSGIKLKENYATTDTNTWDVSVNGDNKVKATLDEDGVLTISGTGKMKNWTESTNAPWNSIASQIKSVKIEDKVTRIGDYAFRDCERLTSIEIPDSVTIIGGKVFYGCTSLASIDIPANVTSIGASAFEDCKSLTNIKIPKSVTSIGISPFWGCSNLKNIEVDTENTKYCIENGVLYTKDKTKIITYPAAKEGTEYTIPSGVTVIGYGAFLGCNSLTSIEIPDSVTTIGEGAFYRCSSLTSIDIPSTVTSIGDSAFAGCKSLTSIEVDKNNTKYCDEYGVLYSKDKTKLIAYPAAKKAIEYEILSSVTTIGESAFDGCNKLTSISIPNNVTTIENGAFYGCINLKNIEIPSKVTTIGDYAFAGCNGLTSIKIPSGVTKINKQTFAECNSLSSIEIPSTVTSIGEGAFLICRSLTNIEIPSAVTKIGDYAFYGCENLTNIAIPSKATTIGTKAFYGCRNITNIEIPSTVTSIGGSAFGGCEKLASISVNTSNTKYSSEYGVLYSKDKTKLIAYPPAKEKSEYEILSSATSIADRAFYECSKLNSIKVPIGVTSIGDAAFVGCSNLTSIDVEDDNADYCDENGILYTKDKTGLITHPAGKTEPEYTISSNVTQIKEYAFTSCENLKNIKVEENNPKYCDENGVLYTKDKTELIAYPAGKTEPEYTMLDSVTSIGDMAFYECNNLTNISIPNSVTNIGYNAFEKCTNLTSMENPTSVTSIWDWAFEGCIITNLVDAANNNIELPEILKRTQNVRDLLFSEAGLALENCTIEGSTIKIDTGASYAKIKVLQGELECLTYIISHNTWDVSKYGDGSIIATLAEDGTLTISGEGDMATWENKESVPWNEVKHLIKNVELKGKITSIGDYAFYGCSNLTSIKIPSRVTVIGYDTFSECEKLTITCKSGTIAEICAKEKGIKYITDDTVPTTEVIYSETNPTNQNVTVTIKADKEIEEVEEWTLSSNEKEITKEYSSDTEDYIIVTDKLGNESMVDISISNIDKDLPMLIAIPEVVSNTITVDAEAFDSKSGVNANSYNYYIKEENGTYGTANNGGTSYTFTNLKSNTKYIVKIEVSDNAGNIATEEIEVVTDEASKVESTKYKVDEENSIIKGINPKTTATEIKLYLESQNGFEIIDLEGNAVTGTKTIGTGYKVKTPDGKEYKIIVWGDFTGDGKIGVAELAIASRVAAESQEIGPEEMLALDISGDGKVKVTDLAALSRLATQ